MITLCASAVIVISFVEPILNEILYNNSEYLKDNYDKSYVYDGDTFETMTLDFYNTTVDKVVNKVIFGMLISILLNFHQFRQLMQLR